MLLIFGCAPPMGLLLPICCWQQFLAPGGPPKAPQETTKMLNVIPQKPQMRHFSILGGENRVVDCWGGAAQLWAGKKLFSPNVLRHYCPLPQISLLRNQNHPKSKIFHFPQKLEFFNFEKKSILQKIIFNTCENFFGSYTHTSEAPITIF